MTPTPYAQMPAHKFWRTGVSQRSVSEYQSFWSSKWELPENAQFSAYGSCFAQHISRELRERKLRWLNTERAPIRTPEKLTKAYDYGVFSLRTGNIYTARQLLVWMVLANDPTQCALVETWEQDGRFYDSLRPAIEPNGFASEAEVIASRISTARAFAHSILETNVFIFTLGLTEGWENVDTGQVYPICPGTLAGAFDPACHVFKNYQYPEIKQDLDASLQLMQDMNPDIKLLLIVSPVPLTATASEDHVLVASTYSKSVLRSVAGDMTQSHQCVDYFPSYEVITGTPSRGMFYEENMRSVAQEGVDVVMEYFFVGLAVAGRAKPKSEDVEAYIEDALEREKADELVFEEMALEVAHAS